MKENILQNSNIKNSGFSLIEVILSVSLFSLFVLIFIGTFLYGEETTAFSGNHARAIFYAEEGLEVVKNIKDSGFSNIIDGTYGLAISGNKWIFSGSSDSLGVFTRQVEIRTVDSKHKIATTTVSWQQNPTRTGTISLVTQFTDWEGTSLQSVGFSISTTSAIIGGAGGTELKGITIENIGSVNIIIDKITVGWDNNNLIEEIQIDSTTVWKYDNQGTPDGRQLSGTELDNEDLELDVGGVVIPINTVAFDGDMSGSTFTIIFTMSDGSTKAVSSFSP